MMTRSQTERKGLMGFEQLQGARIANEYAPLLQIAPVCEGVWKQKVVNLVLNITGVRIQLNSAVKLRS
jgi:hypothetical protein